MFIRIVISQILFLPKKNCIDLATRSMSLSYLSRSTKKNIIVFLSLAIQAGANCIPIYTCGDPSDPHCLPDKANKCNWVWNKDKLRDSCPTKQGMCFDGECHGIRTNLESEQFATSCFVMCCQSESDLENM
ncbi:hypothetical protein GGP41_006667 [Bipolaris sorokiniana]|uniref:Uncharacterized protein n=1 Tax=Cochliobolus sativus TaxID=45130 RepID=A0A8H5ZU16_COCSA|nr:hypothetical protein GGP41_006667 [Bipolaris sorokiniana]